MPPIGLALSFLPVLDRREGWDSSGGQGEWSPTLVKRRRSFRWLSRAFSVAAEPSQQGLFGSAAELWSQMVALSGDLAQLPSSREEDWRDPFQRGRDKQHSP